MIFRFYLIIAIALLSFILTGCGNFSQLQKSTNVDEKLSGALAYYDKKDYYKAGILLDEILPLVRGKAEAERALFYLAYTHFKREEYIMSAYYFKDFYQTYARSEFTEEAVFMHAKSQYMDSPAYNLDQTNTEGAMKAFQEYANRYPKGKFMDETNKDLDEMAQKIRQKTYENTKLYARIGNYKSAIASLKTFIEIYPDCEYTEEMYFLRFQAQYNLSKHSVDHKQLERYYEAIEFYHNFVDKFPNSVKYKKDSETMYELSQAKVRKLTAHLK